MYDGMVVTLQIQRTFIWLESQQGLMATGYTYLSGMMIFKGRTMQESCIICAFDMVCKLEMRYLFGAGLLFQRASYHSIFKRYG
jgi:hypothetical protein